MTSQSASADSSTSWGPTSPATLASDSVLSKHIGALEHVDYVKRRKGVHRGRRTTWLSLAPRGRKGLSAHIAALRALITGID